ncbi:Gfo/Idh/MocA family protein [Halobacterium jilantaiense]|uniref:Predicted dehydrogenase n=1 Tax=Halobacterium jilantaiense TaxID=355548 RepID=A0A1I0MQH6_9EURY|nr:Gfo/Idh/MocA family oxidoreductase [Halobacterium jilantaiense]SEV90522.1 Predicted dehydrogenase [Halobacterium jilantaiense]
MSDPLRVGVVGVGSMGRNHARVYSGLPDAELVGVADADVERASEVADAHATRAYDAQTLLEIVDAVSVVVPTAYHADVLADCIEADVHALVEKPFVADVETGRDLAARARDAGVTLQVGHIERFNPAVRTVADIVANLDVLAVDAERLGPPLDRDLGSNVVHDLMIHDLDVVCALLDATPDSVTAAGGHDGQYATATCTFPDGVVASFTASRVTQQKVRRLAITARECQVLVDYTGQSVEIHRSSAPEYIASSEGFRHRTESVVERPMVDNGEPLAHELRAFLAAARDATEPVVSAEDGLRALELATRVDDLASRRLTEVAP